MPTLRSEAYHQAYNAYNEAKQWWVDCKVAYDVAKTKPLTRLQRDYNAEASRLLHNADSMHYYAQLKLLEVARNDYLTNMAKP